MKYLAVTLLALICNVSASDLDLGLRVQPLPAANPFAEKDFFVWCGAPVKGPDGKYHLFHSRWPVKVGFAPGWTIHSEIAYAVSDKPAGPYQHVNVAIPPRGINPATGEKFRDADVTHNSNAFFHNGKYYLYYMGNHGDGKSHPMHRNNQRIGVAIGENPAGPWKRLDQPIVDISADKKSFDSLCVTNPAAHPKVLEKSYALADGSKSNTRVERPSLLIEDGEPTHLYGAADGYMKNGRISSNIQIPLIP